MSLIVRSARSEDLDAVARLAAELVALHHATDPRPFFLPPDVERGYAHWLGRELRRAAAVVLVAELDGAVAGFAYATVEGRDWNALLDDHGSIHDVFVASSARRRGVGRKLVEGLVAELTLRGARRFVLHTMVTNTTAQALFSRCGFRPTMLEMTRNTDEPG